MKVAVHVYKNRATIIFCDDDLTVDEIARTFGPGMDKMPCYYFSISDTIAQSKASDYYQPIIDCYEINETLFLHVGKGG